MRRLSIQECDTIAKEKAGVVGEFSGDLIPQPEVLSKEWQTFILKNERKVILKGKTPAARAILREGKKAYLEKGGVPREIREVAVRMPYGMDIEVDFMAHEIYQLRKTVSPFRGNSRKAFERWSGMDTRDIPEEKVMAAVDIAEEALRVEGEQTLAWGILQAALGK